MAALLKYSWFVEQIRVGNLVVRSSRALQVLAIRLVSGAAHLVRPAIVAEFFATAGIGCSIRNV